MKFFKPVALIFTSLLLFATPMISMAQVSKKDQARNRFTKGMALYQSGKYLQAIKEMKAAYKIIPKPIVLFYIGEVYKDADLTDEAISYYKRFLDEARINDKSGYRKKAEDAIKKLGGSLKVKTDNSVIPEVKTNNVVKTTETKVVKKVKPKKIKKYKKGELIHTPLEEAQPAHPAKLEVELPEDIKRAWIYIYYRKPGDDNYTKSKMKVDKNDVYYFIIPCKDVKGSILQYYIEAVGVSGRRIAGSATASSPFIVDINKSNPLQPGGKMPCSGNDVGSKDNALGNGSNSGDKPTEKPTGKKRSFYLMVGSGVATGVFIALSIGLGQMAAAEGVSLENAQMSPSGNNVYPPTRRYTNGIVAFSGAVSDYESRGKSYETTMYITSAFSAIALAATTYFALDYFNIIPANLSLDAKLGYRDEDKKDTSVTIAPVFGENYYGIGGTIRF